MVHNGGSRAASAHGLHITMRLPASPHTIGILHGKTFPTHRWRSRILHGEDFPRTLMRGSPDLEFLTKTSGMVSPILPDASSVYLLQKMFVLTMSSHYTPPQYIPAAPTCFRPPTTVNVECKIEKTKNKFLNLVRFLKSRGLGWRIHGSVEDTNLSTNKQHSLSYHCGVTYTLMVPSSILLTILLVSSKR